MTEGQSARMAGMTEPNVPMPKFTNLEVSKKIAPLAITITTQATGYVNLVKRGGAANSACFIPSFFWAMRPERRLSF